MKINDVITEVSLGDYRRKAGMQKAQSQMGAMFGSSPEERARDLATYKKRERGLERVKARDERARKAEQERQLADLVARLPELKAEYEKMKIRYKMLGGSNWQYADREQNLSPGEREARDMEGQMSNLWRQIQAAEKAKGQQGVDEGSSKAWAKHNNLVDLTKPLAGLEAAFNDFLRTHDPEERAKYQQGVKQRIKTQPMSGPKGQLPEQGVAEGSNDTVYPNAEVIKSKNGKPVGEIYQDESGWGCFHYKADRGYDTIDSREDAIQALKDLHNETARYRPDYTIKGVAEDWQKVNRKDKTAGMSRKAVKAYRRENPGSKLQTAVTTKPSKLKKGSKSAKRRKSFCARMKGMKKAHASAKTKRNPDSPINKALRRWNCESIEDMRNLIEYAEKVIQEEKVRLDPKCWTGKKIGNPKTKMKGGVRVNNCVPAESVNEMDKSQPSHGRDGKISHSTYGSRDKGGSTGQERTAKMTTADRMMKDAHKVMMKSMSDADKVKKGWRNPDMKEAANPAQQAAIAIAMKKAGKTPKNKKVDEGKMAEVDYIIRALVDGEMDAYDVMNHPKSDTEQYVSRILHNEYEEVARNHRLHPDDDFEQILDIVVDNLGKDYGIL